MLTYDEYKNMVVEQLTSPLSGMDERSGELKRSMEYSLTAGGKRLRPVLLLSSCDMADHSMLEKAVPFAVATEYIHTYSLIHDDLPAMDDDDYRRGKKTNHIVFGEGMATLAGDALLNTAVDIIINSIFEAGADNAAFCLAGKEIMESAGIRGMISGQAADISSGPDHGDEEEISYIEDLKTGALIKGAVRAGLFLAGAGEEQLDRMTRYAELLGRSFQIADDILDVTGDQEELGKPVGSDESEKKMTYVSLYGLDAARTKLGELTSEAVDVVSPLEGSDFFIDLVKGLEKRNK